MLRILISSFIVFSLLHINLPHIDGSNDYEILNTAHADIQLDMTEMICGDTECTKDWGTDYQVAGIIAYITMYVGAVLMGMWWAGCPWAPDFIIACALIIVFFIMEIVGAEQLQENLDELKKTDLIANYATTDENGTTTTLTQENNVNLTEEIITEPDEEGTEQQKTRLQLQYETSQRASILDLFKAARTALEDTKQRISVRKWASFAYALGESIAAALALIGWALMEIPATKAFFTPLFSCYVSGKNELERFDPFKNIDEPIFPELYQENFIQMITNNSNDSQNYFLFKEWSDLLNPHAPRASTLISNYTESEQLVTDLIPKDLPFKETLLLGLKVYSTAALNTIFPSAFALGSSEIDTGLQKLLSGIGLGVEASSFLGSMVIRLVSSSKLGLSQFVRHPATRAALHAAFCAPGWFAFGYSDSAIKQVDTRIGVYDELITSLDSADNAGSIAPTGYYSVYPGFTLAPDGNIEMPNKTPPKPCIGKIQENKSCNKSIQLPQSNYPLTNPAAKAMNELQATAQGAIDSAYKDDMKGVLDSITTAGKQASNLKKLAQKLDQQLTKKGKKSKIKEFQKNNLKMIKKVQKIGTDFYNGLTDSQKSSLSKAFSTPESPFEEKIAKIKPKDKKIAALIKKSTKKTEPNFKFDFKMDEEPTVAPETAASTGLGKDEEFVYDGGDDINKNNDLSLFKIIENRYKKNAYPVFFEEIK